MRKLFIIAGPQSSGKTTVFQLLQKKFPSFYFVSETNMYCVADKNHRGAAYVTKELEIKIVEKDIEKINNIPRSVKTAVIETGIFHLMYLETLAGKEIAQAYYKRYLKAQSNLKPIIIFIDTKPQISWRRRKPVYEKRVANLDDIERKKAMEKYRSTIYRLYPLWLSWYQKLPFEKYIIKNSDKKEKTFLEEVSLLLKKLL